MKRLILFSLALVLVLSSFVFVSPAAASTARPATVYIIHGIPGQELGLDPALPVDIKVNDSKCYAGLEYKEIAGPGQVAAGTYNLKISLANPQAPCSNEPVLAADVPFEAGEVSTVIAHLTESGQITASKFVNPLQRTAPMLARLAVRHTAAAPTVDIGIDVKVGDLTFGTKIPGLSNPNEAGPVNLLPLTYTASLYPAGSGSAVFGPVDLMLKPGKAYFVYAVGSLAGGSFDLIVHTLNLRK